MCIWVNWIFFVQLLNVWLLDYSILLRARHDELIHESITLHNHEIFSPGVKQHLSVNQRLGVSIKCWWTLLCIFSLFLWRIIFCKQSSNFLSNFQSNNLFTIQPNCLLWGKKLVKVGLINASCICAKNKTSPLLKTPEKDFHLCFFFFSFWEGKRCTNAEKDDFDQRTACKVPICWEKMNNKQHKQFYQCWLLPVEHRSCDRVFKNSSTIFRVPPPTPPPPKNLLEVFLQACFT